MTPFLAFAVFALVALVTGIIIPKILLIAFRKNLFDEIDPRKIHKGAVPRLGGIAFFPAILFAQLLIFGLCTLFPSNPLVADIFAEFRPFAFVTCAIITLYLVGMADDLIGLKYRAKFVAQILSAILVIAGGIWLDNLHGFLGIQSLIPSPDLSNLAYQLLLLPAILLTILLTVFITNAINLIDGIDGLASGLSAVACAFYGIIFYSIGLNIYSMLAFATLGALVPFFCYNVFGNAAKHKKIFMGDTGALTVGIILSVLSIRLCMVDTLPSAKNPAALAFAPLLIPCFDVVRVYLHRIRRHRNPFLPDKTHIHHKLLALGMNQRMAMPLIILANIILLTVNYLLAGIMNITLLFILDLLIWIGANALLTRAIRRREQSLGKPLYD